MMHYVFTDVDYVQKERKPLTWRDQLP